MTITSLCRPFFLKRATRTLAWASDLKGIQKRQLRRLLETAVATRFGRRAGFAEILQAPDLYEAFAAMVPLSDYEKIRPDVARMMRGEANVLWHGRCRDFAQSSGTSGGKSKYIPITPDSLRLNHYAGARDAVAHYLRMVPDSRILDGKALILGGSFANEISDLRPGVRVGDLSATLIRRITPLAGLLRVPSRKLALMSDWNVKLPLMARDAAAANVTNISGVPSWMLALMRRILADRGASSMAEVWPRLEVFFHGGISFDPYRSEYAAIMPPAMRYLENYNASEGFFAVQSDFDDPAMIMLIDAGIFFEFLPAGASRPLPPWEVEEGRTYELIISSCNGLWRYSPGDTVKVTSARPLKIRVAGRTHAYINAFGEELMEWNAERAMATACTATGSAIANYTAAPVYTSHGSGRDPRGHHQWLVEWEREPESIERFAAELDHALCSLNSDYQAKRSANGIFLAGPEIVTLPSGSFARWLASTGTGKLGGQRKIPRLCPDRHIVDSILSNLPS